MAKSRILWGLELILCVMFYVFTDSYAGLWLLAISLVLPIVEMIGAEICAKKLFGTLGIDNLGEKQKDMTAMLKIKNTGLFPFDRIIAKIKCENMLTGDFSFCSRKNRNTSAVTIKKQALRKTLSGLRRIFGNGLFWT